MFELTDLDRLETGLSKIETTPHMAVPRARNTADCFAPARRRQRPEAVAVWNGRSKEICKPSMPTRTPVSTWCKMIFDFADLDELEMGLVMIEEKHRAMIERARNQMNRSRRAILQSQFQGAASQEIIRSFWQQFPEQSVQA